jgi:hypothetical protein
MFRFVVTVSVVVLLWFAVAAVLMGLLWVLCWVEAWRERRARATHGGER